VNYLDFDRELIGQHNEELLREVLAQRLGRQLRTNSSRPRSGRSHTQLVLAERALVGARSGLLGIAH
jgi:hypothetical protein